VTNFHNDLLSVVKGKKALNPAQAAALELGMCCQAPTVSPAWAMTSIRTVAAHPQSGCAGHDRIVETPLILSDLFRSDG